MGKRAIEILTIIPEKAKIKAEKVYGACGRECACYAGTNRTEYKGGIM